LAELALGRLVGEPPGRRLSTATPVDRPLPGTADLLPRSVDALVAEAIAARSERRAVEARVEGLLASGAAALAARRPQVGLLAAVEPARPNARFVPRSDDWRTSWDLGATVTWPLWDGGRALAEWAAASAQADAARERLREFDELVALEVREILLAVSAAQAALEASGQAVAAAAEARRVVDERFAAGVATSSDVLDAQVALLEAELERTELTASLRESESRLLRAVGGLR
jgi:outer membrane protein TolC